MFFTKEGSGLISKLQYSTQLAYFCDAHVFNINQLGTNDKKRMSTPRDTNVVIHFSKNRTLICVV